MEYGGNDAKWKTVGVDYITYDTESVELNFSKNSDQEYTEWLRSHHTTNNHVDLHVCLNVYAVCHVQ